MCFFLQILCLFFIISIYCLLCSHICSFIQGVIKASIHLICCFRPTQLWRIKDPGSYPWLMRHWGVHTPLNVLPQLVLLCLGDAVTSKRKAARDVFILRLEDQGMIWRAGENLVCDHHGHRIPDEPCHGYGCLSIPHHLPSSLEGLLLPAQITVSDGRISKDRIRGPSTCQLYVCVIISPVSFVCAPPILRGVLTPILFFRLYISLPHLHYLYCIYISSLNG